MQIRLQKALAHAGIASRRNAETLIRDGHISVNDQIITQLGTTIDPENDHIRVNGKRVALSQPSLTLMLNKPPGYICSADASQGQTVFALLTDINQRLFTIGRLDKNSEGLLLLTNDGELANRLTHPRYEHRKIYEVTVAGTVTHSMLETLNSALLIDDKPIQPAQVTVSDCNPNHRTTLLVFTLKEGRNRQIRKMCQHVGLRILRLRRIQVGNLELGELPTGHFRTLTPADCQHLTAED